jgi:hypothetical protein
MWRKYLTKEQLTLYLLAAQEIRGQYYKIYHAGLVAHS